MKKVQQPKGITFTEQDAVFGRKCGLRIPNTRLKSLITRHSDAYCGIVQHMAQDKREFVVSTVMEPLLAVGGRFFISEDGVIKQLFPTNMKDQNTIITKIQQGLRDEKKKKLKASKSLSKRYNSKGQRHQPPRTPVPMPTLQQARVQQEHAEITDESVTTESEPSLGSPTGVESTTTTASIASHSSPPAAASMQEDDDEEPEGSMDGTEEDTTQSSSSSNKPVVTHEEIDIAMVKELFEALRGKTISVTNSASV